MYIVLHFLIFDVCEIDDCRHVLAGRLLRVDCRALSDFYRALSSFYRALSFPFVTVRLSVCLILGVRRRVFDCIFCWNYYDVLCSFIRIGCFGIGVQWLLLFDCSIMES